MFYFIDVFILKSNSNFSFINKFVFPIYVAVETIDEKIISGRVIFCDKKVFCKEKF